MFRSAQLSLVGLSYAITLLVGWTAGWALDRDPVVALGSGAVPMFPSPDRVVAGAELRDAEIQFDTQSARREFPAADCASSEPPTVDQPGASGLPLDELTTLLRSGRIEAHFAQHPRTLIAHLTDTYLLLDSPREALSLLQRHTDDEDQAELLETVGDALQRAGDRAGATAAYLATLEFYPFYEEALDKLVALEAPFLLQYIEQLLAAHDEPEDDRLDLQRALLLFREGRGDEARALMRKLMLDPHTDLAHLDALAAIEPEFAEGLLREGLAEDREGDRACSLAGILVRRGETDSARELLLGILERNGAHFEARALLLVVDPALGEQHLIHGCVPSHGELWTRAGDLHRAGGRSEQAIEAWLRAADVRWANARAVERLLEHAPSRLFALLRSQAAASDDDDFIGGVGDLFWQQGLQGEAFELWRRAVRLYPEDTFWTARLKRVARGHNPL